VFLDLREAGEIYSKHRVARLIRVNDIRALPGYRTRRQVAGKPAAIIPNLVKRNFDVSQQNRIWVTDIIYIRTWEGWLYLAIVMDLFSRKIIGWSTRSTIHRELVLDAIPMGAGDVGLVERSSTLIKAVSTVATTGDVSVARIVWNPA